jgi:3-oxosteroid 1-dehydrogenase
VTGLVTDEAGGSTGVAAMSPEGPVEIGAGAVSSSPPAASRATRSCGQEHGVPGHTAWTMAPRGTNAGEPIEAAVALGAATDYRPLGWFCPGSRSRRRRSFTLGFRSGLMVDRTGRRYANECLPYDRFGREMAQAPERIPSWFVFDSARTAGSGDRHAEGDPTAHLAAGTWVSAATLEELAEAAGLPADVLVETVERFNGTPRPASTRTSTAARTSTTRSSPTATAPTRRCAVDAPPYFAARFVLSDLGTKGGWSPTRPAGCCARTARRSPGCTPRQHRGVGLRLGLPRPGRAARLGDGVRRAGRGGHGRRLGASAARRRR